MDWRSRRAEATLEQALAEDRATSDVTSGITIDADLRASGTVVARQDCVICGLGCIPRFLEIFLRLEKKSTGRFEVINHPEMFDGVRVKKGQAVAVIRSNARTILACERVILNLMQRMSGIATATREYVDAVEGTGVRVLDTRKTIPGLRVLDKYSVRCGGGESHRMDLSDGILIKSNHIALGGGIARTLERALAGRKAGQTVTCEVHTMDEVEQALAAGAESLLLDSMSPAETKKAVALIRERGLNVPLEASGAITLENIRKYALTGVNFISVGAITQSAAAVELSMRVTPDIF
jgi:nicotinate-nucleotide pyrophosphorylase (carboxylating)